jgi:hypothetical protein
MTYINLVPTSQETHYVSSKYIGWLIPFKGIIRISFENHNHRDYYFNAGDTCINHWTLKS